MRRDAGSVPLPTAAMAVAEAEPTPPVHARDMQQVQVYIGAASPLLSYTPARNQSSGWEQLSSGPSQCSSSSGTTYAVQLDAVYLTAVQWVFSASAAWSVSAGLDGQLSSVSTSTDAALSASWGSHSVRLEAACAGAGGTDDFALSGVVLTTAVVASGTGVNATLDDSSALVRYTGFQSVSSAASDVPAISGGSFYGGTVSYTSSAGASASFTFTGSAIYVFGATGPDCASFSISIDSASAGTFDAYTSVNTYATLLFFATHLEDAEHSMVITNGQDGKYLALDYFVSVSASASGTSGDGGAQTQTQTAAFPTGTGTATLGSGGGGTNPGGIAGGIIGGLVGLCILVFWYRYYTYRKNGGKGSCAEACCGKRSDKPKASDPEAFKIWPMLSFQPKYAT